MLGDTLHLPWLSQQLVDRHCGGRGRTTPTRRVGAGSQHGCGQEGVLTGSLVSSGVKSTQSLEDAGSGLEPWCLKAAGVLDREIPQMPLMAATGCGKVVKAEQVKKDPEGVACILIQLSGCWRQIRSAGGWELAQCKHGPGVTPPAPMHKSRRVGHVPENPVLGRQEQEAPQDCWPDSLANGTVRSVRDPVSERKWRAGTTARGKAPARNSHGLSSVHGGHTVKKILACTCAPQLHACMPLLYVSPLKKVNKVEQIEKGNVSSL